MLNKGFFYTFTNNDGIRAVDKKKFIFGNTFNVKSDNSPRTKFLCCFRDNPIRLKLEILISEPDGEGDKVVDWKTI